ncbi:hypothetical protein [Ornithinimicrobium cerasi]|uniref:hypothetical protein n=1 Tax=Ornithinimicrobium cerasi TaxID=2248773 RepID=UPI000EFE340D|nr:hypothetical protein [Ornithinimicrobium cerasi]
MSNTDHAIHDLPATRLGSETKSSTKTTEFFAYLAAVAAIVITAFVVGDNGSADAGGEGGDAFGAEQAMRYITFLTIGYMISRGLAKSGSRESRVVRDEN